MTDRRCLLLLVGLGLGGACRIEDHTPAGSRGDEALVRDAVVGFFQARAARDWPRLASLLEGSSSPNGLSPEQYVARLQRLPGGGPNPERIIRADYRQVADLASAWVVVSSQGLRGPRAYIIVLHRAGSAWRIRSIATTAIPGESDP